MVHDTRVMNPAGSVVHCALHVRQVSRLTIDSCRRSEQAINTLEYYLQPNLHMIRCHMHICTITPKYRCPELFNSN